MADTCNSCSTKILQVTVMRTEKDFLGDLSIPADALYGIHSRRARENFPDNTPFPEQWYRSLGMVKHAWYLTYKDYITAIRKKYGQSREDVRVIPDDVLGAMIRAAEEVSEGMHFMHFIVPGISGGAGTSINMNVNEIITNRALQIAGRAPGDYSRIDPIEDANIFQSTNDVVPTSLKLTVMNMLDNLETRINTVRIAAESIEKEHFHSLRPGYTQMQEAVPSSFGRLFSTYNNALSRDWWRVSKASERIKVINLGGGATGTGLTVPRYCIFKVTDVLRDLTGKPVTRSDNLADATCNLDSFVEVHAILKAHGVNLEKMVSDIRLLASDVAGGHGIAIPPRQAGSSIMPGKINPVIPEFVISACHRVYANDVLISSLAAQGCLELNPYLPAVGNAMIESLRLLCSCDEALHGKLLTGLQITPDIGHRQLLHSPVTTTAMIPYIGYGKAAKVAHIMKERGVDIFIANREAGAMEEAHLAHITEPRNLLRLGYSFSEIDDENNEFGGVSQ